MTMTISVAAWPAGVLVLALVTGCGTPAVVSDASAPLESSAAVTLPGWDRGVPALEVPVPEGYTARTDKGRDFDIHLLQPSTPAQALGSIYVGHNPGLLHRQIEVTGELSERSETIGGEPVRVFEFAIDGPRTVREAILTTVYGKDPADAKLAELRVHISVTGSAPDNVDALWRYISRVHVSESKTP
jgi:hypothetical protein